MHCSSIYIIRNSALTAYDSNCGQSSLPRQLVVIGKLRKVYIFDSELEYSFVRVENSQLTSIESDTERLAGPSSNPFKNRTSLLNLFRCIFDNNVVMETTR
ncbi:unnamed protein product [Spodoptera littoralis]|uniref:Uncharacterized protein n=1 Tax=Spodoptera littoralis TaxID=7109 RepID=A0A9P0N8H6_SPOLI|nr:unnamed protein product [Spodoptera littoralis]CAH1645276.1 unnamed protein product [Spodoptera littoralis]